VKEKSHLTLKRSSHSVNTWFLPFKNKVISTDPNNPTDQNNDFQGERLLNGSFKTLNER
jgi:hypothetical protein